MTQRELNTGQMLEYKNCLFKCHTLHRLEQTCVSVVSLWTNIAYRPFEQQQY